MQQPPAGPGAREWVALTSEPLRVDVLTEWATRPGCGAVVAFLGVVRDHADGHDGVFAMTYEAYEEHAERAMRDVAAAAREQWPAVGRVAVVHRVGELALSDASVAVVVSAPHRAEAFEAARFCIDTVKETVPIWKREHWSGGSAWVAGNPIRSVRAATTAGGQEPTCRS